MLDIISQIEKIREINKQNKLVIFVGAGVSKNSGVCSWWELVRDIAIKIGYNDICEKCEMKYNFHFECGDGYEFCSSNSKCYLKYNFSTDEFLKIPQYFIDTKGENEYIDFLTEKFCKEYTPNAIDELIIELNPEHIITTNYDHLLEDVKHPNVSNYTIIKSDKDILEKYGKRYIIKMHGDVDEIKNIVLKEDDYLKFSHTHEIIESYIKSLLFDKTFLFIGYSLNDNNLKLIMSYIDNYVKNNKINNRTSHYLTVNNPQNKDREYKYWNNKGVELVDLSQINYTMRNQTKCSNLKNEQGKLLYSFLKYLQKDNLPYYDDNVKSLKECILKEISSFKLLNYISYTTLLKICNFSHPVDIIAGAIHFNDENDYQILKAIFEEGDDYSNQIKSCFAKSGIHSIQCYDKSYSFVYYDIEEDFFYNDKLFELSINNQYSEIVDKLDTYPDVLEKAYYYFLIYRNDYNQCQDVMNKIKSKLDFLDYKELSSEDIRDIIIYKYNYISLQNLNHKYNNDEWDKLQELLDNNVGKNKAYEYIVRLCDGEDVIINKLNNHLIKHEEYYMRKSTMTKWGGTKYGDLFNLQCIVYDYYKFFKKNHLMLDWFSNVEKVCEPYIKALLCTYYPDEYQFIRDNNLGRTQVEPYPLTLVDIDMIVKHMKFKVFNNWISHYKVFTIRLEDGIDIAEIFENFCDSMSKFWNMYYEDQLKTFSKLISLIDLTEEQKHRILKAYITLVSPDEHIDVSMLRICLISIWIFVNKHYCDNESEYKSLLKLLINKELLIDAFDGQTACKKLIDKLSCNADEEIYQLCSDMILNVDNNRIKCYFTFVCHKILLKFNYLYWIEIINDKIIYNCTEEVYTYLSNGIITFNDNIKKFFEDKLKGYDTNNNNGIYTYPDHKKNAIDYLVVLLLKKNISNLDNIQFLEKYVEVSDYLHFLFHPDSFDYSRITTADYMWCNIINDDRYRDTILKHKSEFWNKDDEKRIRLGFGDNFENRVAYKYLFD